MSSSEGVRHHVKNSHGPDTLCSFAQIMLFFRQNAIIK
jgi:hypothetical protein